MNFVDTLRSFEDALYEVVMWVILLPKTLVQVMAHPGWIQPYVTAEWAKEPAERFQAYLSPMLFWFLLGILPYAFWNPDFNPQSASAPAFVAPIESTFLWNALVLIAFPTYYAVVLQRLRREPLERDAVKRLFYIQCYVHTPVALLGLPFTGLLLIFLNQYIAGVPFVNMAVTARLLLIYLGLISVWVFLVQTVVIHAELKTGWLRSAWLSLAYGLLGFVLMVLFLMLSGLLQLL